MSKMVVSLQRVSRAISVVRGHKVMLDEDLAGLYGVSTKALVQAVKRNRPDFLQTSCFSSIERNSRS